MTDFAKHLLAFAALIGCLQPTGTTAMTSTPAAQTADSSQALIRPFAPEVALDG